jgi:hypothetical protein
MGLRERMAEQGRQESAPRIDKTLQVKRETSLDVDGRRVDFCEYEDAPEGDFVKVCTNDHELGVSAEYAWFRNKYPGAVGIRQHFTCMKLNGTQVRCDILTLKLPGGETRNVYFDISQMMADLDAKIRTGEESPDPLEKYSALNQENYTVAEQSEIYEKYKAEGDLDVFIPGRCPGIIKKVILRDAFGDPLRDAGEDVLVLLKRSGFDEERNAFKKVIEKIQAVNTGLFGNLEKRKKTWKLKSLVQKAAKKRGSTDGFRFGDKAELLEDLGLSAEETPDTDPFTFSPLEKARNLEALRQGLDTFVKSLAPYLQDGKTADLDSRLKDFCDLANKRFNDLENAVDQPLTNGL